MSTPNRIEINRANAQHSTGPKTESGKQTSSLNAIRHGLTSQSILMPTEDPAAYQQHVQSLLDEYLLLGLQPGTLLVPSPGRPPRLATPARATSMGSRSLSPSCAAENQSKTMCNLGLHPAPLPPVRKKP